MSHPLPHIPALAGGSPPRARLLHACGDTEGCGTAANIDHLGHVGILLPPQPPCAPTPLTSLLGMKVWSKEAIRIFTGESKAESRREPRAGESREQE